MEQIITFLDSAGPDFKYFVLGVVITAIIITAGILFYKWEARRATTAYTRRKQV